MGKREQVAVDETNGMADHTTSASGFAGRP